MMFKLAAVAVLGLLFQLMIDVSTAVMSYPTDVCVTHFGQAQSDAVLMAERRFQHRSGFARWIITDILAMPLTDPMAAAAAPSRT